MKEGVKWKQMYENLWETYKDLTVLKRVLYEAWVINQIKLQLIKKYAEENPTTETCQMLDVLNSSMSYEQASAKIKELDGDKYDVIGYGFSYVDVEKIDD